MINPGNNQHQASSTSTAATAATANQPHGNNNLVPTQSSQVTTGLRASDQELPETTNHQYHEHNVTERGVANLTTQNFPQSSVQIGTESGISDRNQVGSEEIEQLPVSTHSSRSGNMESIPNDYDRIMAIDTQFTQQSLPVRLYCTYYMRDGTSNGGYVDETSIEKKLKEMPLLCVNKVDGQFIIEIDLPDNTKQNMSLDKLRQSGFNINQEMGGLSDYEKMEDLCRWGGKKARFVNVNERLEKQRKKRDEEEVRNWNAALENLGTPFAAAESRLKTFEKAADNFQFQSHSDLAKAGFMYTNQYDTVKCFICKKALTFWEKGDIPFAEHAEFEPRCPYVKKHMGNDFPIAVVYLGKKIKELRDQIGKLRSQKISLGEQDSNEADINKLTSQIDELKQKKKDFYIYADKKQNKAMLLQTIITKSIVSSVTNQQEPGSEDNVIGKLPDLLKQQVRTAIEYERIISEETKRMQKENDSC